jgi:hypothetical protein
MKKYFMVSDFLISQMVFPKIICCGRAIFHTMRSRMFVSTTTILLPQKTLFLKHKPITKSKLPIRLTDFQARQLVPLLQRRFDKTLVGYENGLIVVINEADGAMLKAVDIINKQLPANTKKESFHGI